MSLLCNAERFTPLLLLGTCLVERKSLTVAVLWLRTRRP